MAKTRKTASKAKTAEPAPAAAAPQDSGYVSEKQTAKAIEELKKYIDRTVQSQASTKLDLFAEDNDSHVRPVFVTVELKKIANKKPQLKPKLIALEKPFLKAAKELKTCFFVRDNLISTAEQLEQIEDANIPTLSKIISLKELKTVYNPYDKREELRDEYDVFVVDSAIFNSMPVVLGKTFYESRKFPVHIRVDTREAPKVLSIETVTNEINKVLSSTAYIQPIGTNIVIDVGSVGAELSDKDLISNVRQVLEKFPKEQVLTVGLSAGDSPVLPLFYTDKLYEEADVLENASEEKAQAEETEDVYTKALLELADEETVAKVIGKKLKAKKSKKTKEEGRVSKP